MKTSSIPIGDIIKRYCTKENLEKITKFLQKAAIKTNEFADKYGDELEGTLDSINNTIEDKAPILCDVTSVESLSSESIKKIIESSDVSGFTSVALLKDGYNQKEEKHMFYMMFLDSSNSQLKNTNVMFINCKGFPF